MPDPVAVLAAATDVRGNAESDFQLANNPSLRGQKVLAPWLVVAPGGCSPLGLSFSNAIEIGTSSARVTGACAPRPAP